MKKLIRKLKQNKGETLTEVLIGLLVACIAMAMFTAMLQNSGKMMSTTGNALESYYTDNSALIQQNPTTLTPQKTVTLKLLNISYGSTSNNVSRDVQMRPGEVSDAGKSYLSVYYFTNSGETKVPVTSYKYAGLMQPVPAQNGGDGE